MRTTTKLLSLPRFRRRPWSAPGKKPPGALPSRRQKLWLAFPLLGCLLACDHGQSSTAEANESTTATRTAIKLSPSNPRLAFVKVEPVALTDASALMTLTGKVGFDEEHTQRVASPIDGRVTSLLVRPGDKVHVGQPLFELSSPAVGQIEADAQKAQQDLTVTQKALDRVRKLREDGAVSDKEVAQSEADFRKARSDVARSTAQLKSLGLSAAEPAARVSIRAQVSGTVIDRSVLVGQEVRADGAAPLMLITNLDLVWVLADVYEQDLGMVVEHGGVHIKVPAYPSEDFPGAVGHIGDIVDAQSRTVKIRCVVANKGHRLKPEMFARVELEDAKHRKVLEIPARAVLTDGDQSNKVIVATDGDLFTLRAVEIGAELSGKVRVLAGLAAGDRLVTDGALFLKHEIDSR